MCWVNEEAGEGRPNAYLFYYYLLITPSPNRKSVSLPSPSRVRDETTARYKISLRHKAVKGSTPEVGEWEVLAVSVGSVLPAHQLEIHEGDVSN